MKGKQDPIALEETEYPEWLWGVLDTNIKEGAVGEVVGGDEFCEQFLFFPCPIPPILQRTLLPQLYNSTFTPSLEGNERVNANAAPSKI